MAPSTLDGVLARVRAGDRGGDDPLLRARIDAAFARHEARLRAFVAIELRPTGCATRGSLNENGVCAR